MLIGRWRPSAFSVSVFVISRDSISKPRNYSSNSTLTTASPPAFAFYLNFALRKNPRNIEAVLMEMVWAGIDRLNEGNVNFIMLARCAMVERRKNGACNIDNETCTWTGNRNLWNNVHWFIIYTSLLFNWFNWFVQCRNTMVLYLMERDRLTLSFSELFNSHCYPVCEFSSHVK